MAMFNFDFRAESEEAKHRRKEMERLSGPPSLPIMRVLLEKGYPEDAIGDIKTQGQAERIIELWPKAEKPLPPLMGTRRIKALEERGIEPTLPEIKKGYGMYIEPPKEEKEVPLFSTITGATQMYPESEANRLKMTAPKLYRTFEDITKPPEPSFEEKEKIKAKYRKPEKTLKRFEQEEEIKGKIRAKYATKKEGGQYTIPQQIDDTRAYYSLKMRALLDPITGFVKEGQESEYEKIIKDLAIDELRVRSNKMPNYLKAKVSTENMLKGKKPGRYLIDGKIVKWDGKKVIP